MWKVKITNQANATIFESAVRSLSMARKTIEKVAKTSKDPNGLVATITDLSGKVVKKFQISLVNGRIEMKEIS